MSLILEALRKLEREKPAPERGVVVMTSAAWSEARPGRGPWLWLTLGLAAGVAAAVAFLEWRRPPASTAAPVSAPATTAPRPAALPAPATVRPMPQTTAASTTMGAHAAPLPSAPEPTPEPTPVAVAPKAPTATATAAPSRSALVLQAITIQDGHPVALINDRILREGDEIDGVRIRRIGDAEVEIERDGKREVLRF